MDRIIILYAKTNIMSDDATNESEKILESLFEPDNAEILVELKDGPKLLSFLMKKIAISKEELDEKLSYLIEKGFVSKNEKNDDISYLLDTEKLSKVLENDDNFKNIDDGLIQRKLRFMIPVIWDVIMVSTMHHER